LPDGSLERDHHESAKRQLKKLKGWKGATPPEPPPAPLPRRLAYLWRWFGEISMGLAATGMAPSRLTWPDVAAWSQLMGVKIEPWEARVLIRLGYERAFIQSQQLEKKVELPNAGQSADRSGRAIRRGGNPRRPVV
jgi:hypothetical protein